VRRGQGRGGRRKEGVLEATRAREEGRRRRRGQDVWLTHHRPCVGEAVLPGECVCVGVGGGGGGDGSHAQGFILVRGILFIKKD